MRLFLSLTAQAVRPIVGVIAAIAAVGLAAGLVRLLPWLLAPEVPGAVTRTFAELLLSAALRAAALVGGLAGLALAHARWRERGELLALESSGVRPFTWLSAALVAMAGVAAPLLGTADLLSSPSAGRPGAVVQQITESARGSCHPGAQIRRVPVLGLTWWCTDPPRVVGPVGRGGWFTAKKLQFSDDLDELKATDLTLATTGASLRAREAEVRGLRASVAGLAGSSRGWLVRWATMVVAASALICGLAWRRPRTPSVALAAAGAAGVVLLVGGQQRHSESWGAGLVSQATVVAGAVGILLLCILIEIGWFAWTARRR